MSEVNHRDAFESDEPFSTLRLETGCRSDGMKKYANVTLFLSPKSEKQSGIHSCSRASSIGDHFRQCRITRKALNKSRTSNSACFLMQQ